MPTRTPRCLLSLLCSLLLADSAMAALFNDTNPSEASAVPAISNAAQATPSAAQTILSAKQAPLATSPTATQKESDSKKPESVLPWMSTLSDGYRKALTDRKPVLVRVGARWCEPCRKLAADVQNPVVQAELARWTLVAIDIDAQPEEAAELDVVTVPALRIRTADGQPVAGRDGYVKPDELVAWLKSQHTAATSAVDDVLLDSGKPSPNAVLRLVKQFQQRNPMLREAAIRRLIAYPEAARPAVVKAFCEGNLSVRLAALEVLQQWKAPLAGYDPWQPDTLTPQRLADLEKWIGHSLSADVATADLTPEELASARRQVDRLLAADDLEANAIGHRLARLGAALIPEIVARLKEAAADQDRRRLLILRYRLIAADALALRWPGGVERLADNDPRQRRHAAEQLAKLAVADDQPLLLELFSDPDPLVREISLRGLHNIGGIQSQAALVRLLSDPEPNVRAAVLKQFEENPDPAMTSAIVKYLKQEKDPDLVVHGIRFLQATKGAEATKCLMSLLKHESWQVRSEAAAGIGKLNGGHTYFYSSNTSRGSGNVDPETQLRVDSYVALLVLLDDPDDFVVAKAVEGLANADLAVAVEPLAKVAVKHPDLAVNVLQLLANGSSMREKAIPHIRKFCKHAEPRVRAAAIAALCDATNTQVEQELADALADQNRDVRITAASSLFKFLDKLREQALSQSRQRSHTVTHVSTSMTIAPQAGFWSQIGQLLAGTSKPHMVIPAPPIATIEKSDLKTFDLKDSDDRKTASKKEEVATGPKPGASKDEKIQPNATNPIQAKQTPQKAQKSDTTSEEKDEEKYPWDQWIVECYAGQHRPKWTGAMTKPLETMLASADPKERAAAALALVPLGKADASLSVLIETGRQDRQLLTSASQVLPWLIWEKRIATFNTLRSLTDGLHGVATLAIALSEIPDQRAADPLWDLLADAKVTVDEARSAQYGLLNVYVGQTYFSPDVPASRRRLLIAAAKPRTASGSDWQRVTALAMLAAAAPDEASHVAAQLAADPKLSDLVRNDAFQVQLVTRPKKESRASAIAALKESALARKKVALNYLVDGGHTLSALPSGFYLNSVTFHTSYGNSASKPIVPEAPKGITIADVRPLLTDPDADVAARAGYILVLLGDADGLPPLLKRWRQRGSDDWARLLYRAIAVVDEPSYMPVLQEIYSKLEKYRIGEFYWTIRIMSGPEALKFRKRIRDEAGTTSLQYQLETYE